jgi:hypothetical protein
MRRWEVAEAVDGDHAGLTEGRYQETGRQMREVVLDTTNPAIEPGLRKRRGGLDRSSPGLVAHPVEDQREIRPAPQRVPDRLKEVGARIGVDGDDRDIGGRSARLPKAVADRLARPVLDAAETFLLRGGDDRAVAEQARGAIPVVGVDA